MKKSDNWKQAIGEYIASDMCNGFEDRRKQWEALFRCFRIMRRDLCEEGKLQSSIIFSKYIVQFTGKLDYPIPLAHWRNREAYKPSRKFSLWLKGKWEADCFHFEKLQREGKV
jgi:hypothetical protein